MKKIFLLIIWRIVVDKQILDVCCGSRMFRFNKHNDNVVFMDNRVLHDRLCDGRKLDIVRIDRLP